MGLTDQGDCASQTIDKILWLFKHYCLTHPKPDSVETDNNQDVGIGIFNSYRSMSLLKLLWQ